MIHRYRYPAWLLAQPHFATPYVVFQSDDWGHACASDQATLTAICPDALRPGASAWMRDARESPTDLAALGEALIGFRDAAGNPPVFTLNCIVHVPDFDAIERAGFQAYFHRPAELGHVASAAQGTGRDVHHFELALHGGEHVEPETWLHLLRNGDASLRACFDRRVMPPAGLVGRYPGLGAAYLAPTGAAEHVGPVDRLRAAMCTFRSVFGHGPRGFAAPNHAWDRGAENVLAAEGVTYVQAAHHHYATRGEFESQHWTLHRMGDESRSGIVYQTRTVDFEPGVAAAGVALAHDRARLLLQRGIPVVVNTHRINYVSSIDAQAAARNLALLQEFIHSMVRCRPDLRFVSSHQFDSLLRGSSGCGRQPGFRKLARFAKDIATATLKKPLT